MPGIEYIRAEIERMRIQVHRQRGEISQLQRVGIPTASAEALLDRMLNKIDGLCAERDRLKKEQPRPFKGKALGGRRWGYARAPKMVRRQSGQPAAIQALAEVRRLAPREGAAYHPLQ